MAKRPFVEPQMKVMKVNFNENIASSGGDNPASDPYSEVVINKKGGKVRVNNSTGIIVDTDAYGKPQESWKGNNGRKPSDFSTCGVY